VTERPASRTPREEVPGPRLVAAQRDVSRQPGSVRVLQFWPPFDVVGGVETLLLRWAEAMPNDVDMALFATQCSQELLGRAEEVGLSVMTPCSGTNRLNRLRDLTKAIRTFQPDVLHAHGLYATVIAGLSRSLGLFRVPIISHLHNAAATRNRLTWLLERAALSQVDMVISCSQHVLVEHLAFYRANLRRSIVIYTAVDVCGMRGTGSAETTPAPDSQPSPLNIVTVGRLGEMKGLDVLIESLAYLGSQDQWLLNIIGEGPERPRLEALIRRHGWGDQVRLLGFCSDDQLRAILRTSHIYAQPSRSREGLPATIVEAMAVGLPVVATTVGGIPEAVEHNVTGVLVPPEDPVALGRALNWMIDHPVERREMGQAGHDRAERCFDLKLTVDRLAHLYRDLAVRNLAGRPGGADG